jgi:Beta-lactamase
VKFRELFRFQLVYQARRVRTWIYFAVLFVVAYLVIRGNSIDDARNGGALVNSPYVIAATTVISSLLWVLMGSDPGWSYSDIRGFGPFLGPWLWFTLYWAAWALLLAVAARLLWARGTERSLRSRLHLARGAHVGRRRTAAGERSAEARRRDPDVRASGQETGYGLGWDLETVALAGKQTRLVGHDGDSLGGMVASLMTFPEHGIVMSVMSNISYADTFGVAVKIAQAFAEQRRSPARK